MESSNVFFHPTSLEARATQAMADYAGGKVKAIHAVIEYGKALLEGRVKYPSDKQFGKWITDSKLDVGKPWGDRRERVAAVMIAEIVTDGKLPSVDFDACPNSAPTNIMKWYREQTAPKTSGGKTTGKSGKSKRSELEPHHRVDEIMVLFDKGMTDKQIAIELGIGDGSGRGVRHVTERIRIERKAVAKAVSMEAKVLSEAEAGFSDKSKFTVKDAIRIHKARLDKAFEVKVGEEVRKHLAAADEAMRKENAKLRKDNLAINLLLRQGAIFTAEEYKTILRCLHPDNSGSAEIRARAFDLVKQKEKRLTGVM